MFDVNAFIDRAKVAAQVESDYALAVKVLGYKKPNSIYNWRSGYSAPDARAVMKLCSLTGDDPGQVVAKLQEMRATNQDEAALWRRVADKLSHAVVALAIFCIAAGALPERATASVVEEATPSVCIMSSQ